MKAHRTTSPPDSSSIAPRRLSRGTMLMAAAALFLVVVLAYSGPSWAIGLYRLLTDGVVVLLWLGAAAGAGWWVGTPLVSHQAGANDGATRLVPTFVALGLGFVSLLVLGLGLIGLLNAITAWAVVGVGLLLLAVRAIPRRRAIRAWLRERPEWSWPWLLIVPFIAVATIAALMPPGILWSPDDPHPYDVVEYHLQIPREWYEAGRIMPLAHNVFSYFPFNVEMQYLLAMHLRGGPWAGMYIAQLMHVAYVMLSIIAVYSMTRQWCGRAAASMAALAAASAAWVWLLAPVAYNEGGLLLYGTLAIGYALQAMISDAARTRPLALAGAMTGFACGVKLTAAPLLLVGIPVALVITARSRTPRKALLVFIVMSIVTFAPWLVRNAIWSGNPVFPEAQSVFGRAHFSQTQSQRWKQAHAPAAERASAAGRIVAMQNQILFDWRYGFALLPLAIVAGFVDRSPRSIFLGSMLAIALVFWLGFTHLQGRFFILAVPLAAMLVGLLERWRRVVTPLLMCMAVASFVMLHVRLTGYLYGAKGLVVALGVDSLHWAMPAVVQDLTDQRPIALAGDARAFLYDMPMSRLQYRTVFDVDVRAGEDVVSAWTRGSAANAVIVVDPVELDRFAGTYFGIPAAPQDVRARSEPFIREVPDKKEVTR